MSRIAAFAAAFIAQAILFIPVPVLAADQPTVLVTGSNRGIGLEIARLYAERGWQVIATCRTPSDAEELQAIAETHSNLVVEALDVTDEAGIAALAEKYEGKPIDILINNAGIPGDRNMQGFGNYDWQLFDKVYDVNVKGPMRTAVAFIDNIKASDQKKIINISSTQGSIAETQPGRGNSYFYKSSKSALNMMTYMLSQELKKDEIVVGLVSPGWVDTNFGGLPSLPGMITPEQSAASVVAVIDDYGLEKSGTFFTHDGQIAPW